MSARATYEAARRRAREEAGPREDRGLPPHPDGSGWADCPDCGGAGEVIVNDTNPYGYGSDPQCDEPESCSRCASSGRLVDGPSDPLLELCRRRQARRWNRIGYAIARKRAMRPVSGLAQADMLAMAARCVTATDAAVAALVKASNALLAGSVAQATAADHPDMTTEDKADAEWRASGARDAMRAALARVGAA